MKRMVAILPFFVFPAGVLLAYALVLVLRLPAIYPNLDMPFHFMGGFSIAYMCTQILAYFEKEKTIAPLNIVVFLLLVLSLTATAAVFWEFAEFGADRLLGTNAQVSLANTMQDQFLGICGGAAWVLIYMIRQRRALSFNHRH
jgi:hypothetical protein